ncbi:MAG: cation transporter [Deltaproteobacteria bacterium]|nr:cation transporter [Deltaproteobacteria bacterium]
MRRVVHIGASILAALALVFAACPKETTPDEITGPAKIELQVTGMTCAVCVGKLTKSLREVSGVGFAHVDLTKKIATVLVGRKERVSRAALLSAVKSAGDEYAAAIVEPITYVR